MADSTTFNRAAERVTARVPKAPKAPKVHKKKSGASVVGDFTLWAGLIVAGVLALGPIIQFTIQEADALSLKSADEAGIARALQNDGLKSSSADKLETLAELSLALATPDNGSAYAAAQRATQLDPSRAFAWANLAWLETAKASGQVNQASLDALVSSMNACPLCSEDLIRWRFNFVLANWTSMPETVRRRAFEQADLLRWAGQSNAEFLAEMRAKARQNGIPYDGYRGAVNTPARTWDIGPAPQARDLKTSVPR